MPPLHTAQDVHEVVAEEYRILDSVNYELATHSPADWVCLFETRFSLSVEHVRQRFPQGTGSCFSEDLSRRTVPLLIHGDISGVAQRNVEFKDAATQLSFAEFFERCILSETPPPRPTPLLQPRDVNSLSSTTNNSGPIPVPRAQRDCTPRPPPGFEEQTLLGISHNIPSGSARLSSSHGLCPSSPGTQPSSQIPPAQQPHVSTTQVGPHPILSTAAHKRSAGTALSETHPAFSAEARAGRGHSLSPCQPSYPFFIFWPTQATWTRQPPQCRQ